MAKYSDKYKWSEYENHDTPLLHRSRSMRSSFRFIANRASMKRSSNNNQQTFFQNNYKHLHNTKSKSPNRDDQQQQQMPPQNTWNTITREIFNDLTKENKRDLPNLPKNIPPKAAKILNIQPIPLEHLNQLNQDQKYHHHHHKEVHRLIPHHQQHRKILIQGDDNIVGSGGDGGGSDVKTFLAASNLTKNQIKIRNPNRNHLNDNEIQQLKNINLNSITTTRSRSEERCLTVMPPPQFIPPLRRANEKSNGTRDAALLSNGGHVVIKNCSTDQSRK